MLDEALRMHKHRRSVDHWEWDIFSFLLLFFGLFNRVIFFYWFLIFSMNKGWENGSKCVIFLFFSFVLRCYLILLQLLRWWAHYFWNYLWRRGRAGNVRSGLRRGWAFSEVFGHWKERALWNLDVLLILLILLGVPRTFCVLDDSLENFESLQRRN